MQFLSKLASLTRDGNGFIVRLDRKKDEVSIVIEPILRNIDPDEENEALRNVQAALVMPIAVKMSVSEDVSIEVEKALSQYLGAHGGASDARDALISSINEATAAAREAVTKNKEKGKSGKDGSKGSNKLTKSTSKPVEVAQAESDEEADNNSGEASATASEPSAPNETASSGPASNLFAGLED